MSNMAMPLIVLNLGGEMMYILKQRLEAQNVPEDRGRKVLEDVLKTMFSPSLIGELFRPQETYTNSSTMQLFHKLAHSSIMRLNKSSMDKLYDLMTMGVKNQVMVTLTPQQMLHVTLNHLETMKLMTPLPEVVALVQSAIDKALSMYAGLSDGHWIRLKSTVLRFFQGKKVKVSLFLQNGKQLDDGEFVLGPPMRLAHGVHRPGCIRYMRNSACLSRNFFEYFFPSDRLHQSTSTFIIDLSCQEGRNTYCKARGETQPVAYPSCLKAAELVGSTSGVIERQDRPDAGAAPMQARNRNPGISSAKAEISLLSDLLGGAGSNSKDPSGSFTLNLFPNPVGDGGGAGAKGGRDDDDDIIHFNIDATADAKTMDHWADELDLKGFDDHPKAAAKGAAADDDDDDDDLPALVDAEK